METLRERRSGVWEVRAFVGRDPSGRPVHVSRTVQGTKRDAQRVAAELTLRAPTASVARMTTAEMLDLWAGTIAQFIDERFRTSASEDLARGSATIGTCSPFARWTDCTK